DCSFDSGRHTSTALQRTPPPPHPASFPPAPQTTRARNPEEAQFPSGSTAPSADGALRFLPPLPATPRVFFPSRAVRSCPALPLVNMPHSLPGAFTRPFFGVLSYRNNFLHDGSSAFSAKYSDN